MNKKIIIVVLAIVLISVLGYIGLTYKQYGKLSKDTSCGQEFELAFNEAVMKGNTNMCESGIKLNSYRYYYYNLKNGGWRWSPRYCRIEEYPTLLFRVNEELRTLEDEGNTGVYTCVTYITEQAILRNNTDQTLGLIEVYKYRMNELNNPSGAREILRDLMKLNTPAAQEFLISQAENKNLDSYTRTTIVVSLPKYVETTIAERTLADILSDVENDPLLRFRTAETLVNITGSKYLSEIELFNSQTSDAYLKDKLSKLIENIR
jgi:hypothetical protein